MDMDNRAGMTVEAMGKTETSEIEHHKKKTSNNCDLCQKGKQSYKE